MSYLILFLSAFGAATVLPFYSEVTLIVLLEKGFNPTILWLVASAGNTMGSVVNWVLGLYVTHFESRPWFPFKEKSMQRSELWFQKYGVWSLLLAWLPIGGDALTFIAGVMRVRFWKFLVLVAIGKSIRYGGIIVVYFNVF